MNKKKNMYIYYFIRISRLKSAKFKNITNKPGSWNKPKAEILKNKQTNKHFDSRSPY